MLGKRNGRKKMEVSSFCTVGSNRSNKLRQKDSSPGILLSYRGLLRRANKLVSSAWLIHVDEIRLMQIPHTKLVDEIAF